MKIGRRVGRAVAAVAVGSLVGIVVPSRAHAVPGAEVTFASTETGACGWWWKETAREVVSVSVCGTEGASPQARQPGRPLDQVVVVDWYACATEGTPSCRSQHHEGKVTGEELVLDPLLRMGGIHTVFGSCVVDLWFSATSEPEPEGGLAEAHSLGATPGFFVAADQTVWRPARWTGKVCGVDLVDGSGSGATLWRGAHGGITSFGRDPGGHEE